MAVGPGHKKNRSGLHAFLRGGAVSRKSRFAAKRRRQGSSQAPRRVVAGPLGCSCVGRAQRDGARVSRVAKSVGYKTPGRPLRVRYSF